MKKKNIFAILIMTILIPVGISTKYYHGFGDNWVNNSLGGVLYVTFGVLLLSLFLQAKAWKISVMALALTSIVEVMQLSNLPILQLLRSS